MGENSDKSSCGGGDMSISVGPSLDLDGRSDSERLRRTFYLALAFAALLWMIKVLEVTTGMELSRFGVFPLRPDGLTGVLFAPLIHGSWGHLALNSPPVVILGTVLMYGYPQSVRIVLPVLYLGVGILVWIFGRSAYHIGASGLTFGVMFFIFIIGALRWDKRAIALSLSVFVLYGGMVVGLIPGEAGISFESHLAGAVLGTLLAYLLRNRDPRPPEKKYSWEEESDADETCQTLH